MMKPLLRCTLLFFAAVSVLLLSGCQVHFIAAYDPVLDNGLTQLQQSTEQFLGTLDAEAGLPEASWTDNQSFYTQSDATLRTLITRAQSEPISAIIVQELQLLEKSYTDLMNLHQTMGDKGLSHVMIVDSRSGLENSYKSIFTLELALQSRLNTAAAPTPAASAPALTP
jgi:hypothetical protein